MGMVADNPDCKIELKAFHANIVNKDVTQKDDSIPVVRQMDAGIVAHSYNRVKTEVQQLTEAAIEKILNDPSLAHLVISKND